MAEIIATAEQREQQMGQAVSRIEQAAAGIAIIDDDTYQLAAAMLTSIKGQQNAVTDFFEPLRKTTKAAYDSVLKRRKDMLDPLNKAEAVIKKKLTAYQEKVERDRAAKEAELKRLAEAEREAKFEEAVSAEASGDALGAELAMLDAEVMDDVAATIAVAPAAPKAAGISYRTDWEITGIDPKLVPVEFAGAIIRPVDEKAVKALIKASKGKIQIPGITYKAVKTVSARSA